jgi:alkyl sulfatase BDS1-like metallo-beta-lactamase superfamily hydrolase
MVNLRPLPARFLPIPRRLSRRLLWATLACGSLVLPHTLTPPQAWGREEQTAPPVDRLADRSPALSPERSAQQLAPSAPLTPRQRLEQQGQQFSREIIDLGQGVYMALGYDGSNVGMIVGQDGVIIVDTLRTVEGAEAAWAEFRKITDKPVKAIIYTHGHGDHIGGAAVFAGDDRPAIYARANFSPEVQDPSPVNGAAVRRGTRQFGRNLTPPDMVNRGIAPGQLPSRGPGQGFLPPTVQFEGDRWEGTIAGVRVQLVAAPGETEDQLYVWLPDLKVLFSGDNFYNAFPNLYAIRGTPYRDVQEWAASTAAMATLGAEVLIPGHTRPLRGKDTIARTLSTYSQGIQSIFDQTIAGINQGLTPDQLVERVKLPPELAQEPHLTEFYGAVPWGVRSIFQGYLGWFDGNATNLFPLAPAAEAQRWADLVGAEELLAALREAIDQGDYQWGLELADRLIALGDTQATAAKTLKIQALRALAEQQINAPARNYYLSVAKELEAELQAPAP